MQRHLKRNIQTASGGHDSAEDAKAAMELVQLKITKGEQYGIFEEEGPSLFATLEEVYTMIFGDLELMNASTVW